MHVIVLESKLKQQTFFDEDLAIISMDFAL